MMKMMMDFLLNQTEIEMRRRVSFSILPIELKKKANYQTVFFSSTTTMTNKKL